MPHFVEVQHIQNPCWRLQRTHTSTVRNLSHLISTCVQVHINKIHRCLYNCTLLRAWNETTPWHPHMIHLVGNFFGEYNARCLFTSRIEEISLLLHTEASWWLDHYPGFCLSHQTRRCENNVQQDLQVKEEGRCTEWTISTKHFWRHSFQSKVYQI